LQRAFRKYGSRNFQYEILKLLEEEVSQRILDLYEDTLIQVYEATTPSLGYNSKTGGYRGSPTEETRQRISSAKMGHEVSEETRRKVSQAQRGVKEDPVAVAKRAASNREAAQQRPRSAEFRRAVSTRKLGTKHTEESKERMRLSSQNKGRFLRSEETKRKIAEAAKLREAKKRERREDGKRQSSVCGELETSHT
jgi:hypothetical protein